MTLRLGLLVVLLASGCRGQYIRPVSDEPITATPGAPAARQLSGQSGHVLRRLPYRARTRQHPDRARAQGRVPGRRQRLHRQGLRHAVDPEHHTRSRDRHRQVEGRRDPAPVARRRRARSDFMVPVMPFAYYQHLSDEDARSVVAYLRSVPPYRQERPRQERKLGVMQKMMFGMVGVQMHKPVAKVPAPDRTQQDRLRPLSGARRAVRRLSFAVRQGAARRDDPLGLRGQRRAFRGPGGWARCMLPT